MEQSPHIEMIAGSHRNGTFKTRCSDKRICAITKLSKVVNEARGSQYVDQIRGSEYDRTAATP